MPGAPPPGSTPTGTVLGSQQRFQVPNEFPGARAGWLAGAGWVLYICGCGRRVDAGLQRPALAGCGLVYLTHERAVLAGLELLLEGRRAAAAWPRGRQGPGGRGRQVRSNLLDWGGHCRLVGGRLRGLAMAVLELCRQGSGQQAAGAGCEHGAGQQRGRSKLAAVPAQPAAASSRPPPAGLGSPFGLALRCLAGDRSGCQQPQGKSPKQEPLGGAICHCWH